MTNYYFLAASICQFVGCICILIWGILKYKPEDLIEQESYKILMTWSSEPEVWAEPSPDFVHRESSVNITDGKSIPENSSFEDLNHRRSHSRGRNYSTTLLSD